MSGASSHNQNFKEMFTQPRAVWAVAFAAVIAFMGIGLVDPILPAISAELNATPTQAEYLFTSYLFITGLAMLFTSWVSSRIGAKSTLLIGLALIVIFAALAGASGNVNEVIGFRAGWGLGNALFISTALATIVGAAAGGLDSAIILYEAALGLGIAIGPLVGGWLGSYSWRGPFFGTAVLMAIGFIGITVLLRGNPHKPEPVKFAATFKALGNPALLTLGIAALFYNFGFFTLLAYTPFPLETFGFGAQQLGFVFFGWGVCLAITSVFVAPRLTGAFGRQPVLYAMMALLAIDLGLMAVGIGNPVMLVICVIIGGLFLGVVNTVLTESVMQATDLPRSVASSAYSAVRFVGGAMAPALAGTIAAHLAPQAPYWVGASAVAASIVVLLIGRGAIKHIDLPMDDELEEAEALTAADAS